MKSIKSLGLIIFIVGMVIFTGVTFLGEYSLTQEAYESKIDEQTKKQVGAQFQEKIVGKTFGSAFALSGEALAIIESHNSSVVIEAQEAQKAGKNADEIWGKKVYNDSHKSIGLTLARAALVGPVIENSWLYFFLTFGLAIIGGLMFILPDVILLGPAGIKNNGITQDASTNRGWIGMIVFVYLVGFYLALYFWPDLLVNQIAVVDGVSRGLSGNPASQWFLYGFIYCTVMTVMSVRMFIKYRHNKYQIVRTSSVLFFQIAFAFLIPEIMVKFNMPWMDFKNAWPLDYDFFFQFEIDKLIASGSIGIFMIFWGVALTLVIVPVLVYIYGKRWYCSWVCGCGGLAETLGDPYRQLSDKSLRAWKLERWLIHGVMVFAVIMTVGVVFAFLNNNPEGYWLTTTHLTIIIAVLTAIIGGALVFANGDFKTSPKKWRLAAAGVGVVVLLLTVSALFTGQGQVFFVDNYKLQSNYGFLIGSVFSGIIGTGFYPILGNRSWCRFGCPLAAYMGLVQRFKSRFRITTNGGQCISCGNCSTYCEQGIDVRWYAQRGQNIVRSSCVGCGVCAAVCPRGVLKLENGPEEGRINDNPIIIGNNNVSITDLPKIG